MDICHVGHILQDFFGRPAFLTVSGQLNAEIYATALCDVRTCLDYPVSSPLLYILVLISCQVLSYVLI